MQIPNMHEILGIIIDTLTTMPTESSDINKYKAIAIALENRLGKTETVKLGTPKIPCDIFDTEHVDDIPVDIKPKKAKYEKELPGTMPIQVNQDGLPIPEIIWREKPFSLDKCYLGKYSNPCTTSLGQCRKPCVQTELWLYDKKTDYLTVVDVEFADLESLHRSLDPWVEYAHKHHTQPEYIDHEINDAMEDLAAAAKELRSFRTAQDEKLKVDTRPAEIDGKTRIEQFLNLYNRGFKTSQIAREMGITEQYVYNLKNQAKTKGLIK